ncbi:shikimate kinase [Methanosalsum natronophilum]|uniref:shikimate kinase n=1 Tax=Methanosalsum natronophilum TaxID=768733 RepID=UPI002168D1A8|nr:shikimate kinase [Methanosalsum natronophilum]MCS3924506.1 shikimate kinase [Methanosalsum natronophilum]
MVELSGRGHANGAGTIINAISTWKGSAFSIDMETKAKVELSSSDNNIIGMIEGYPEEGNTCLIERTVQLVLNHFNLDYGGTVTTNTEIPLASGLKSSSAASNAAIIATLNAINEVMEPIEAIKIGVQAAKDTNISITGAFDDACASMLGGVVITDNYRLELVKRDEVEMDVLVLAPHKKAYSAQTDVARSKLIAPWVDIAYSHALNGNYKTAMTLNGFLYCNALKCDTEPLFKALEAGVQGVTLSGTGPSYVALVEKNNTNKLKKSWTDLGIKGNIIETKLNNKSSINYYR